MEIIWIILGIPAMILLGGTIFALPALALLPRGRRPGLEPLSLSEAATLLQGSGKTDWELVEEARLLVNRRMHYCRRNSWDSPARAFDRGYGYCMHQSLALEALLRGLGFSCRLVQCVDNEFPGGFRSGHSWVRVVWQGEERDADPTFPDSPTGTLAFEIRGRVTGFSPWFLALTLWGSGLVNAGRFYRTGKDC